MSNTLKAIVALGLFTVIAACSQQEEEVIFVEEPVMDEPAMDKM